MKRIITAILLLAVSLTLLAGCENDGTDNVTPTAGTAGKVNAAERAAMEIPDVTLDEGLQYYATIDIADYGIIKIELDADEAPITVANFVAHAQSGFYDGLTFHRIISGFMIQGGDPYGNGRGGSSKELVGEFSSNGYSNIISHVRGVISMARSNDPDSASSQFFIVQEDSPHLDGDYAAFGYVTEGMDVVDKVCQKANPTDSNGTIKASEQPVINKITISTEKKDIIDTGVSDKEASDNVSVTPELSIDTSLTYYADIEIEGHGTITVQLDHGEAPITVDNFVSLAQSGFYDGLTFHRIISGFMIQGGDPNGNGTGGSDNDIVGEFSANGYDNDISHKRGVISMARASAYNSGSSQFFIMHQDADHLDGLYAAFGYVTEGIEIVDDICSSAQPIDGNGTITAEEQPVISKITIRTE